MRGVPCLRATDNVSSPVHPRATEVSKATKAGREFEAVLLNQVLGKVQQAFTHLPGTTEDYSSQAYSGFATEALTAGLASAGGVGLAGLITKALLKRSAGTEK